MEVLKTLPCDLTFNQEGISSLMKDWKSFYCFDLSNATDRFPVSLQVKLLESLAGKNFADHWHNIMVKAPFSYKGNDNIYYRSGQPMGAYSS